MTNDINRKTRFTLALAVAAMGGVSLFSSVPSYAASVPPAPEPANMPADMKSATPIDAAHLMFRNWSKFKGENLYSVTDDKKLGDIVDILISRGSGRIDYAVVKTDTTLGFGGKLVLIPYNELTILDGDKHEYRFNETKDQIKNMPEFTAQGWADIGKPNAGPGSKTLAEALARQGARERADVYATRVDTSQKPTTIEGKITDVDRRWVGNAEYVFITVQDDAGKKQDVNLGPAWFAMGGENPPIRGERVKVSTLRTKDGEAVLVATTLNVGGHDVRYRQDSGMAVWSGADESGISPARHVLATEIISRKVDTKGSTCGKVDDLIFERASGYVAFLSIDPDQNFMGIGDTKRLVPFAVANPTHDGRVSLDASKEMVLASAPYPKTLDELRSEEFRTKAYGGYQVHAQNFVARQHVDPMNNPNTPK